MIKANLWIVVMYRLTIVQARGYQLKDRNSYQELQNMEIISESEVASQGMCYQTVLSFVYFFCYWSDDLFTFLWILITSIFILVYL